MKRLIPLLLPLLLFARLVVAQDATPATGDRLIVPIPPAFT